jgi:hypothetical protein
LAPEGLVAPQSHDDTRQTTFVDDPPVGQHTSLVPQLRAQRSQCDLEQPRHTWFSQQIPSASGGGWSAQSYLAPLVAPSPAPPSMVSPPSMVLLAPLVPLVPLLGAEPASSSNRTSGIDEHPTSHPTARSRAARIALESYHQPGPACPIRT